MSQFSAYENPNPDTRHLFPALLDIQSNLLDELKTTIVIPLCPARLAGNAAMTRLCPKLDIKGKPYIAMTPQLAGVNRNAMGRKMADLSEYRQDIIAAMDFVLSGY